MIVTILAAANVLFNIFLCTVIPEQTVVISHVPLILLIIAFFSIYSKITERPFLVKIAGPLSLITFCLAVGSHELDRQSFLYQCNMKAALYLMIAGMNNNGPIGFLFHGLVIFLVPFVLQLILMDYNPLVPDDFVDLTSKEGGYENSLVFIRQFLLSALISIAYYVHLRTLKANFVRASLHEMNEKSVHDVLDEVSEPILIVKQKHKLSMKPKYMNKAAKEILQFKRLKQEKRQYQEKKKKLSEMQNKQAGGHESVLALSGRDIGKLIEGEEDLSSYS